MLMLFAEWEHCWLIHWDLKLFILFVMMNNSFVLKDIAVEVAVVDRKALIVNSILTVQQYKDRLSFACLIIIKCLK